MDDFSHTASVNQNIRFDAFPARGSDACTPYDVQKKLRFAGREILRMENEGGPALNDDEAAKVNAHFQLTHHVQKLFFNARARRGLPQI
ncbi:MAG: hypothetical protein ABL951_10820 [Alphaproteobacteria bacterium]